MANPSTHALLDYGGRGFAIRRHVTGAQRLSTSWRQFRTVLSTSSRAVSTLLTKYTVFTRAFVNRNKADNTGGEVSETF